MGSNKSVEHVNKIMNTDIAESQPVSTINDIQKAIPIRDTLRYVKNDTYVADVSRILGRVYFEKLEDDMLWPFLYNIDSQVDPGSKLNAPETVSELIVDSKITASTDILSFISANLEKEELLEVRVINNASARVIDRGETWDNAIMKWMAKPESQELINDPNVGTISVVTGAVQKYLTTKKYKKFSGDAKGGGWGVNVEGSLYTSTSKFELKVLYGLDLVTFKKVRDVNAFAANVAKREIVEAKDEIESVNTKFSKMVTAMPSAFTMNI